MIKILIADDHPIVRQGLKSIITCAEDMTVEGEAGNAEEIQQLVRKKQFDVLLLDISMPGQNGLEVLKYFKSINSNIKILVLSIYPTERYAMRALFNGASGYLTKDAATEELISAIRKVSQGGRYVSTELADILAADLFSDVSKPLCQNLSDREFEIMCLIGSGKRLKDIASELSLSIKTISTYRKRVLNKLRMKNNSELMHYVINNKLLE